VHHIHSIEDNINFLSGRCHPDLKPVLLMRRWEVRHQSSGSWLRQIANGRTVHSSRFMRLFRGPKRNCLSDNLSNVSTSRISSVTTQSILSVILVLCSISRGVIKRSSSLYCSPISTSELPIEMKGP
jgi:hypothetical protein